MSSVTTTTTDSGPATPGTKTFGVVPFLRYADATAAARWLVDALGFAVREVFPSADDVQHGELQHGSDGLVMIGPAKEDHLGLKSPRALGGSTHGIALVVSDPDASLARARAAGAEIVRDIADTPYGSRDFTCRDTEGHLWTVGTYRPQGAASLTPYLQVADGQAAVAWLRDAFGLEPTLVVPRPDGGVAHAELLCKTARASGMVMLGQETAASDLALASARRLGGTTQGIYIPVPDADAHHRRATAAGATIVHDLADMPYGSREYTCRDPEGNLWSFGTYLA
jgi:uncharacterized glyoxalase superfamily protein PhnB